MATRGIERRTVLVVGKTGAGKSTVCNKLVNKDDAFQVDNSYDNPASKVRQGEVKIPDESTNQEYQLKVIDSIGFFGRKISKEDALDRLKSFLQTHNVQGINLVLFVFRKGRFTPEEEEAFKYLTDNFKDTISNISALVITDCDNINDEGRQQLIQEFRDNKTTRPTAEFMKKGIYAVGFPDTKTMKETRRRSFEEDIEADRNMLLEVVTSSREMHLKKEIFYPTFWENLSECIIL